jgi:hypothetical protein
MDVLTIDRFFYDVIYDDSQTDVLYLRLQLLCTAMVNGQSEVRTVSGPPISYTNTGAVDLRTTQSAATAPTGASVPVFGADTDPGLVAGSVKQRGAIQDLIAEAAGPANLAQLSSDPSFGADVTIVPVLAIGPGSPIVTQQLISQRLTDVRAPLFVFAGTGAAAAELLWQSPLAGNLCDAKGGPKPTFYGINQVFGDGVSFFVTWGVESYLPINTRPTNDPLLSNRFQMTHDIDEDSYLNILVSGRAVFDLGVLQRLTQSADFYRPQLMLPIPLGFVRKEINVTMSADGSYVDYSFRDEQSAARFVAGPYILATKVEAVHKQYIDCDADIIGDLASAGGNLLNNNWLRKSSREHRAAEAAAEKEAAWKKTREKLIASGDLLGI